VPWAGGKATVLIRNAVAPSYTDNAKLVKPTPISSRCSKSTALKVATQFQLGVDPTLTRPIAQVLCGAFVGPGSNAMAASIAIPSCGRTAQWAVFRWTGTEWQLVLTRNNGADLDAVGSDIRETQFVLRPTDSHCFPTGGTRSRVWHWDGKRFTATPWKAKLGAATAPKPTTKTGYFKTPSGNIQCYGSGKGSAHVVCGIKSGLKPPPRPCVSRTEVSLRATGQTTTICLADLKGDVGVFAFDGVARVLGYGKKSSGGGITCTSAVDGLTCRNKEGHGFFLSRESWRRF